MASDIAVTTPPFETGDLYEMAHGHILEQEPMGAYESRLASILLSSLELFAKTHQLGRAVAEMLFDLTAATDKKRRPDVAFVSYQRWPRNRRVPRTDAWEVVPELAVEIISPSNTADTVVDKTAEYFRAGVQRVWVVFPSQHLIYDYSSPSSVRILSGSDQVDAEPVLPGYQLGLTELFENGDVSE